VYRKGQGKVRGRTWRGGLLERRGQKNKHYTWGGKNLITEKKTESKIGVDVGGTGPGAGIRQLGRGGVHLPERTPGTGTSGKDGKKVQRMFLKLGEKGLKKFQMLPEK